MVRFGFKIPGIFMLLCGVAAALPQAQIRTGVSAKGAQATDAPVKAVKNGQTQQLGNARVSNNRQQKPTPAVVETPAPVVPATQQVQPPLRPEQMPPVPPKVIYQNGLLSVESTNSTLSDILNGIRTKAGIQIEGFQGAQDRVAAKLGPAPVDTVLTTLLRGSHFDYMILGRVDRPDIVQRVILTPASGSGLAAGASNGIQPLQPRPGMVLVQPVDDDEANPDEQAGVPQPQVQPLPQPGIQPVQPVQQSGNGLQGNGPKTSEQLLEELKQMQQQQQQQNQPNQQQNLQPPPPLKPRIPQ
jgi:hypothetical protein